MPEDDLNGLIWESAAQQAASSAMNDHPVAGHQSMSDRSAAADKVFAQLADEEE